MWTKYIGFVSEIRTCVFIMTSCKIRNVLTSEQEAIKLTNHTISVMSHSKNLEIRILNLNVQKTYLRSLDLQEPGFTILSALSLKLTLRLWVFKTCNLNYKDAVS